MEQDVCATIPLDTTFHYLAEGAANVVYRIEVPLHISTPPPSIIEEYEDGEPIPSDDDISPSVENNFENKLLRLRKDLPTTTPCHTSHQEWLTHIAPLFPPSELITQTLVSLPPSLIPTLNTSLKTSETPSKFPSTLHPSPSTNAPNYRPPSRQKTYLAADSDALLITNMLPTLSPGAKQTLVEFKPKWLSQSPSAPPSSRRCRQCARTARDNASRARHGMPLTRVVCPLLLVANSEERVEGARGVLKLDDGIGGSAEGGGNGKYTASQIRRFTNWVQTTPLLSRLQALQKELDSKGPLLAEGNDLGLRIAMTLRDCTVFVRMDDNVVGRDGVLGDGKDMGEGIEARIGDLDLKSPAKAEYWRSVEMGLIAEGWYEGMEEEVQPVSCLVDRMRGKEKNRNEG